MNEYMVMVSFPREPSAEFFSLIPQQRQRVNEMMREGTLTSYSLSADRVQLWATVVADSRDEAITALMSMPLFRFMEYDIRELMFHTTPLFSALRFSVN